MKTVEKKVSHTPGPWKAELVRGWQNNTVYCRITSDNFEHPGGIAYASIPFKGKTKKQQELAGIYASQGEQLAQWNAKLIAAAPELLAELQTARNFIEVFLQKHPSVIGQDWREAMLAGLHTMDNAIKKATS